MGFTVTVVHTPDAFSAEHWEQLRSRAPGAYDHELRLVLDDPGDGLDGPRLDELLHRFLGTPGVRLSTAGTTLSSLQAGSALIHSAMVVLISSADQALTRLNASQLRLCLDSGPDAGRLIPLRRGRTQIGRGQVAVSAADPAISRKEAVLEVGTGSVLLHQRRPAHRPPRSLTTEDQFRLGSTHCRLSVETPPPQPEQSWPPLDEPVRAKPPQSRNKMMLAFALVPLVAGIVLVTITGMWFFLLFSGASALIASAIFWDGRRQRKKYRQHVRQAAQRWGRRTHTALCSPGDLILQLRAHSTETVYAGASAAAAPAVRLGTGTVIAGLDVGTGTDQGHDDDAAQAAVGITLEAGEQTRVAGPLREARRLLRWVMVQLVMNPARPQTVLLSSQSIPELRDLTRVSALSPEDLNTLLAHQDHHTTRPGVLVVSEPEQLGCTQRALSAGWHVVTVGPELAVQGWLIDLQERRVEHRNGLSTPEVRTEDLRFDGLSHQTLREHLRLALPHGVSAAVDGEVPPACTHRLPEQMFTDSAAKNLIAVLGRNASGVQNLDLIEDGPHVLIAGTSGSGKSELLKTLLISLCARYGPQELGLVLIDFKGGSAFHRLSRLEHTLGLVTDLSQSAAERTLEGLRSELFRREQLFLESGAGDYAEYRQLNPQRPLARILVVIDEFRIFSHELPDQLDELMRLATLGRSLGLHLVLSTQRPQGVVTADIRANIGSSICLRVRSEEESRDVIGSTTAATIERSAPGRAALRLPGEAPRLFQTAQLSGCHGVELRPEANPAEATAPPGFSDAVEAVRKAACAPEHRRRHTPLLPSLPERLAPEDRLNPEAGPTSPVLLGRLDDPSAQLQEDLVLDLENRPQSVLLLGETGSGISDAAAAAAAQALNGDTAADVHLLDGDRSMAALADHPRVGSWLTEEDLPEVEHLLQVLCEEMAARRVTGLSTKGGDRPRPLLVVVTGFSQWHASSYSSLQSLEHLMGTLAAEGPQAGISVMICGGRELTTGKLAARVPTRIYLPLGTSEEMRYLWPKLRSTDPVPGRGVLLDPTRPAPGTSVQLVTAEAHAEQPEARQPDGTGPRQGAVHTPQILVRPLPERIPHHQIPVTPAVQGAVVGIRQFTWEPAGLPLGPVNLILGSRGSGKSSCLQLLQQQMDRSALLSPGGRLPQTAPQVLLVDDAAGCSTEQHSYIQQAITAGVPVVAAAAPSPSVFSQLPWAHPARTEGSNVVLSPTSRSQADAFATIIPVLPRPIPGRAVHLRPEGPAFVQWALPG